MDSTAEILHRKFNRRSNQIPPVRIKRFHRNSMAKLFSELEFKCGAEIGVRDGCYSVILCEYCVDLWDIYLGGPRKQTVDMHDKHFDEAHENLNKYEVTFIRKPSMEAIHDVPDKSLDFVYIDGSHEYRSVKKDIELYFPKVANGGVFGGHDYSGANHNKGVKVAGWSRSKTLLRSSTTSKGRWRQAAARRSTRGFAT